MINEFIMDGVNYRVKKISADKKRPYDNYSVEKYLPHKQRWRQVSSLRKRKQLVFQVESDGNSLNRMRKANMKITKTRISKTANDLLKKEKKEKQK